MMLSQLCALSHRSSLLLILMLLIDCLELLLAIGWGNWVKNYIKKGIPSF